MTTGKRLAVFGAVLVGATAYMAYLGGSSSWQYYATVDECLSNLSTFTNQRIRVSGKIAVNTLQIAEDRKQARFALRGSEGNVQVVCSGPLPENLAEGRDVVAEGVLSGSGDLQCDKILTQCASKYQAEVKGQPRR
jgi:cytochrome c-type biogenesis protein CcmE